MRSIAFNFRFPIVFELRSGRQAILSAESSSDSDPPHEKRLEYGLSPRVRGWDPSDRSELARGSLADTKHRSALNATESCIAMYFVQATTSGQLYSLPTNLPPGLYDQASGKFDTVATNRTGSTSQLSPSTSRSPPSTDHFNQLQYPTRTRPDSRDPDDSFWEG